MGSVKALVLVLCFSLFGGIAMAASMTMDDLKDKDAKAHVARIEALIKKMSIPDGKLDKAYTRLVTAVKEIEPLERTVSALAGRKGDPKAAKELQLRESRLRIARNRVYLGLWGDVGETSARVLGVYALNTATDAGMDKDADIIKAKDLAKEPVATEFGHLTLLVHALMAIMEDKPGMRM